MNLYSSKIGLGIRIESSGYYLSFTLWVGKTKDRFYKELRVYHPRWWRTQLDKKGKVHWQGTVFEIKG